MRNLLIFTMAFMLSFSGLNAFAKDGAAEIPLTFSGYVHTATTYNLGDNEDESNNYHTFSDDDFTMTPSAQIGVSNDYFVIDALFGSLAEDLNDTDGEFFLHQAYGILPIGPLTQCLETKLLIQVIIQTLQEVFFLVIQSTSKILESEL